MDYFTVDQAGKIEDTNQDTILAAYSQKVQFTVRLPKELKQDIFNQCKARLKNRLTYRIFAYSLYLLLKDLVKKDSVVKIDDEYTGHARDIKNLLLNHLDVSSSQIGFEMLGKEDQSHRVANQTFSGKMKPNRIITEKQLKLSKIIPSKRLKEFLK